MVEELNQQIAGQLNQDETIFLVDSIPIPVCQIAREKRSKICKKSFETALHKTFTAVSKSYFNGYILHLLTSMSGVFPAMDLSKASIHNVHYLSQVKYPDLNNCTLIADRGYLSSAQQLDLLTICAIELQTPSRANQKDYKPFSPIFKRTRKRIETHFTPLCDQFMIKRNYAKSVLGISVRILSKITAVTLLQFINLKNDKPLNH